MVYVVQASTQMMESVLALSVNGSSNNAPASLQVGSGTFFGDGAIATDLAGQLYAAGTLPDGSEYIKIYAAGATGKAQIAQAIPASPGNLPVYAMATDTAGNLLVAGATSVQIFAPSAGVAAPNPTHTISLPTGQIPIAVSADAAGNVYVACNPSAAASPAGSVFEYAVNASGSTLVRTITTNKFISGLAADPAGDIYLAQNTSATDTIGGTNAVYLSKFLATAIGSAPAIKTISGDATGMTYANALRVDSSGNVYVLNISLSGTAQSPVSVPSVLIFGPTASGNQAPAVALSSPAWVAPGSQLAIQ